MKYLVFALFILTPKQTFCQSNAIANNPIQSDLYTFYEELGLTEIQHSSIDTFYRFLLYYKVVDVWVYQGRYNGMITSFVNKCSENDSDISKVYHEHIKIHEDRVKSIFSIMNTADIKELPTDDSIKDWPAGGSCGGVTYVIESKIGNEYSFKTYSNPSLYIKIPEAIIINDFIDTLHKVAYIDTIFSSFLLDLPFDCYTIGAISSFRIDESKLRTPLKYKLIYMFRRKRKMNN